MPDPKIIDYLRQNKDKYPLESLKQALIKNGFSPADVDEAILMLQSGATPPPPRPETVPAGPGVARPGEGGRLRYSPGSLFSNAIALVKDPAGFFSQLDPEAGIGGGVLNVILWALISALISLVMTLAGSGGGAPMAKIMAISGLIMVPIVAVVLSFIGAAIFHVLCKIMGGTARYAGSYNVLAGIIALAPVSAILHAVHPIFGPLPIQLYGLYLSVLAAWAVHAVPKKRAWIVFGLLTFIGIGSQIALSIAARRLQGMSAAGLFPAGSPEQALQQAQQQTEQALQSLGGDAPALQATMQQSQQQAGQVLQDMSRFGAMASPPQETLALLDKKGQSRLSEAWPKLSAPVRQSLVQALPQVPADERLQSIEQTVQATAGVNEMVNQSMQLLQQLQQPQPQGQGRDR